MSFASITAALCRVKAILPSLPSRTMLTQWRPGAQAFGPGVPDPIVLYGGAAGPGRRAGNVVITIEVNYPLRRPGAGGAAPLQGGGGRVGSRQAPLPLSFLILPLYECLVQALLPL
jgi:hypothetical protein